eukprot:TRINITY_DN10155_c0_g1_i1.p1 TRINITY_DN10155_c0_g1~~TRINITY_DN10155_c0_g1_i1.p1  ORF type:complete len:237 (-),score=65.96 TRINITY_DN10155_c0_g1_i1:60-770(-)
MLPQYILLVLSFLFAMISSGESGVDPVSAAFSMAGSIDNLVSTIITGNTVYGSIVLNIYCSNSLYLDFNLPTLDPPDRSKVWVQNLQNIKRYRFDQSNSMVSITAGFGFYTYDKGANYTGCVNMKKYGVANTMYSFCIKGFGYGSSIMWQTGVEGYWTSYDSPVQTQSCLLGYPPSIPSTCYSGGGFNMHDNGQGYGFGQYSDSKIDLVYETNYLYTSTSFKLVNAVFDLTLGSGY